MRLNDKNKNNLLKEYIQHKVKLLLKEFDDDFGDYGAGGYGGRPGSTEFTLGIFGITGVMNVLKTAAGVGEAILTRTLGEAWILARRLWFIINPAYAGMSAAELENIISRDRASLDARLDRVHAGYADTVREAEKVIENMGSDINAAMFLANPGAYVGYMATRGSVGAARNLYHRITVGGPPPAGLASREASLSSRAAELEREHENLRSEMARRGENSRDVMRDFARELLGPNATVDDLRNFISSARNAAPAAGAAAVTEQLMPSPALRVGPPPASLPVNYGRPPSVPAIRPAVMPAAPTRAPARTTPAPAPASSISTEDMRNNLRRRTEELKRDYVSFLNSNELKQAISNLPAVEEGQKALTDMVVRNYENVNRNLTFDKMREEHEEEFANIEEENPTIFDSEEKKRAFETYARQQLSTPAIAQLEQLARDNPNLRDEVTRSISEIRRIAGLR